MAGNKYPFEPTIVILTLVNQTHDTEFYLEDATMCLTFLNGSRLVIEIAQMISSR